MTSLRSWQQSCDGIRHSYRHSWARVCLPLALQLGHTTRRKKKQETRPVNSSTIPGLYTVHLWLLFSDLYWHIKVLHWSAGAECEGAGRSMASPGATSMRALSMEFKALQREPVEGFIVTIPNDADFYAWQVAIFGPPDTPYQGGYFKVSGDCQVCTQSHTTWRYNAKLNHTSSM